MERKTVLRRIKPKLGAGAVNAPHLKTVFCRKALAHMKEEVVSPRYQKLQLNHSRSFKFGESPFLSPRVVKVNHAITPQSPVSEQLQKARSFPKLTFFNRRPVPINLLLDSPRALTQEFAK